LFISDGNPYDRGEGKTYLGQATANAAGEWAIILAGADAGQIITSTATDVQGNTSEFCPNFTVVTDVQEFYTANEYSVFPNPASDYVYLNCRGIVQQISISDMSGKIIYCRWNQIHENQYLIILPSDLSAGNYLLQWLGDENQRYSLIFTKE